MEAFELVPVSLEEALAEPTGRFLQSPFWALFKSRHEWQPYFFRVKPGNTLLSVLVRRLFPGASLAYIPLWPEAKPTPGNTLPDPEEAADILMAAVRELNRFLPRSTLCIRFDPAMEFDTADKTAGWKKQLVYHQHFMRQQKFKTSLYDVQPPDSVVLDLSLSADALLTQMKGKCRYNIRLAEKSGVKVRRAGASEIGVFYGLYQTTAQRDRIAIHAREYYESLLSLASSTPEAPEVRLYIAEHQGEALAAIINLFSKQEAVYLYGASSNEKRSLMPAYLLQWQAIQDAKEYGSAFYDFYGIPPTDDEKHPMHGLYRFKTGFGGRVIHRIGSIDAPTSWLYGPYRFLEGLRGAWYKRIYKLLRKKQS